MGCSCGEGLEALSLRMGDIQALLGRFLSVYAPPAEVYEATKQIISEVTADGSGNATVSNLGGPLVGQCWWIEVETIHASSGTPQFELFVGQQGNTSEVNRRDWSNNAANNMSANPRPIYVGPGDYVTLKWTGAAAAALLSWGAQVRVCRIGNPTLVGLGAT